jgi:hypothetical protein
MSGAMSSSTQANPNVERRAQPRRPANFIATVTLGSDALPCYVVNLSKAGAMVRLFKPIRLPRGFTFLTCARFGRIRAELVWQIGAEIGFKFPAPGPASTIQGTKRRDG